MRANGVALSHWAKAYARGVDLIGGFVGRVVGDVEGFVREGWISGEEGSVVVGGLSRGGFVGLKVGLGLNGGERKLVGGVFGFSPVVDLGALEEFEGVDVGEGGGVDVGGLVDGVGRVKFWVGNNDRVVKTGCVWKVAQEFTEGKWRKGQRKVEVCCGVFESVGIGGHGTREEVFKEGARWIDGVLFD